MENEPENAHGDGGAVDDYALTLERRLAALSAGTVEVAAGPAEQSQVHPPEDLPPPPHEWPEEHEVTAEQSPMDEAPLWPEVQIEITLPAVEVARIVAETVRDRHVLFVRDDVVVTRARGKFETLDPVFWTTWLYGQNIIPTLKGIPTDFPESVSARVLRSIDLKRRLLPLNGVNAVRLPVQRASLDEGGIAARRGFRKIDLLPVGYDEESGIWTEGDVDFPTDWEPDDCREWFDRLFRYFPWEDENRLAVQMAAIFTLFCREMYVGRAPMFVWNSNLPNSGKSTLSRLPLMFILGRAVPLVLDQQNRRELQQELNTAAMAYVGAVWFDDAVGKICAPELRTWITEDRRGGRALGGNRMFDVAVRAVTFVTGAQLGIDDHMGRRSLWVDLFPQRVKEDRVLPDDMIRITARWMLDPENRRQFLAACWAAVRHWDQQNRPEGAGLIDSLENWSEIVPGIVAAMGWGDCLAPRTNQDTGDLDSMEGRELIRAIIREYHQRGHCSSVDVMAVGRMKGLFRHILGDLELLQADLDMRRGWRWKTVEMDGIPTEAEKREQAARFRDQTVDSKWGKVWRRLALENLQHVVDGRRYYFRKARSNQGSMYEIIDMGPA